MRPPMTRAAVHWTAWVVASAVVLWWTLLPFAQSFSTETLRRALADVQWVPFVERGRAPLWSDLLGNLVLFVPFGFAGWRSLENRRARLWIVAGSAAVLSLLIEGVQLTLPARRTSATDLVTDVLGASVGAGLGRLWEVRGREAARHWVTSLIRGSPTHVFVAAFALCLLGWAVLPGTSPTAGVWRQIQSFSSSFRRFPGWQSWLGDSVHPFLLGWLSGALITRSMHRGGVLKVVLGTFATAVVGLGLETLQLLSPGRRPEIYQALAFALGGFPGAATGLAPRFVAMTAAILVFGFGSLYDPRGDMPPTMTRIALLLGAVLLATGSRAETPSAAVASATPEDPSDVRRSQT